KIDDGRGTAEPPCPPHAGGREDRGPPHAGGREDRGPPHAGGREDRGPPHAGGWGGGLLNLILEVSGQKKKEKDAKVQTAKTMWVPGVNNLGTFGRWSFLEIDGGNLHKTKQEIRKLLKGVT